MERTKLCERSITLDTIDGEESGLLIVTAIVVRETDRINSYDKEDTINDVTTYMIQQTDHCCRITEPSAMLLFKFLGHELDQD